MGQVGVPQGVTDNNNALAELQAALHTIIAQNQPVSQLKLPDTVSMNDNSKSASSDNNNDDNNKTKSSSTTAAVSPQNLVTSAIANAGQLIPNPAAAGQSSGKSTDMGLLSGILSTIQNATSSNKASTSSKTPQTGVVSGVANTVNAAKTIGDTVSNAATDIGAVGSAVSSAADLSAAAAGIADATAGAADAGAVLAATTDAAMATGDVVGATAAAAAGGGDILASIGTAIASLIAWIICTEFVKQGRLPKRYWIVCSKIFAAYPERVKNGYYLWAIPSVRHIRRHPYSLYSRFLCAIFNWRAENIAAHAGVKGARKLWYGAAVTVVLYPACYLLGFLAGEINWQIVYDKEIKNV